MFSDLDKLKTEEKILYWTQILRFVLFCNFYRKNIFYSDKYLTCFDPDEG
jgi:hypothetical protein